jgi:hypothetical protein
MCVDRTPLCAAAQPVLAAIDADASVDLDDDELDELTRNSRSKRMRIPDDPHRRPARVMCLNQLVRLARIQGRILDRVYATDNHPARQERRVQAVTQLSGDLAAWLQALPAHLRWRADDDDPASIAQSGCLLNLYSWAMCSIHRCASAALESTHRLMGRSPRAVRPP